MKTRLNFGDGKGRGALSLIVVLSVLPYYNDRPEELGIVFGLWSWFIIRIPGKALRSWVRAGVLLGLSLGASPAAGGQVDGYIKTGKQRLAGGDLAQAQGAFNKARELDTHNADAYAGLGEVAFEQGDYSSATVQLKQALRLSPNRARFLILLGQAYYKLGKPKEAVQEYKRALRVDPTNQEAQHSLELAEKKL